MADRKASGPTPRPKSGAQLSQADQPKPSRRWLSSRYPMILPVPTAIASFKKYGTVEKPLIGDVRVGVGNGARPRPLAMAIERSSWNGAVAMRTVLLPRA